MSKKRVLAVAAVIILCGCGNKNESKDNDEIPIPTTLDFTVPQKAEIPAAVLQDMIYWDKQTQTLDGAEFVIDDPYQDYSEKQKKQERYQKASADVKDFVQELRNRCHIEQPYKTKAGKITDQIGSQESELKKFKINGDSCPIEVNASEFNEDTLTDLNQSNRTARGRLKFTSDKVTEIKNQRLLDITKVKSNTFHMELSGTAHVQGYNDGSHTTTVYAKGPATMVIRTVKNGDITLSARTEILGSETSRDAVVRGTLKFPSGSVNVVMILRNSQQKLYINGQDFTGALGIGMAGYLSQVSIREGQSN
jgi:hypothetical protein